jgi:hypothetical protein
MAPVEINAGLRLNRLKCVDNQHGISKQVGWRKRFLRPRIRIDECKANESEVDAGGKMIGSHPGTASSAHQPDSKLSISPSML